MATRLGKFDEADRLVSACQARRPDDPAVWRARLDWAVAACRPDEARKALAHVPADLDAESQSLTLRAWFAARDGNPAAERVALERLTTVEPGSMRELHPDLREGDAFLHNDPLLGNTHTADHTILVPVFVDGEHIFTTSAKAHQADCGNAEPSTYVAYAEDVYAEGGLVSRIHGEGEVLVEEHTETGTRMEARVGPSLAADLSEYLVAS